jgi:hypothetical protein
MYSCCWWCFLEINDWFIGYAFGGYLGEAGYMNVTLGFVIGTGWLDIHPI